MLKKRAKKRTCNCSLYPILTTGGCYEKVLLLAVCLMLGASLVFPQIGSIGIFPSDGGGCGGCEVDGPNPTVYASAVYIPFNISGAQFRVDSPCFLAGWSDTGDFALGDPVTGIAVTSRVKPSWILSSCLNIFLVLFLKRLVKGFKISILESRKRDLPISSLASRLKKLSAFGLINKRLSALSKTKMPSVKLVIIARVLFLSSSALFLSSFTSSIIVLLWMKKQE